MSEAEEVIRKNLYSVERHDRAKHMVITEETAVALAKLHGGQVYYDDKGFSRVNVQGTFWAKGTTVEITKDFSARQVPNLSRWERHASDPVRQYYRSLTPDGKLWCESRDPEEVRRMSVSKGCTFERLDVYEITEGWKPWTLREP